MLAASLPSPPSPRALTGARAAAKAAGRGRPRPRFERLLPIPPVLTGERIELEMREAEVRVLPGRPTRMWTYGGEFPGPTIRRPAGQRTEVAFSHRLPAEAGELTVHLHGGHNRADDDGQPGGLTASQPRALYCRISPRLSDEQSGNDLLIPPGGSRTYIYDLMEDGAPERAAFQWYHDHRMERTARNVWRGLAGMWIIDDELDASLPLPSGERDLPLLIADRDLDSKNQLRDPFSSRDHAPNDGVTGPLVLVNGAHLPYHRVEGARHRLRILNASNFRSYNLALSNDQPLTQIATESGLLPRALERDRILLGPGERVEIVVDFRSLAGRRVELVSAPRRDGPRKLGSIPFRGPLMQFRVGRRVRDRARVPVELRPLPDWVAEAPRLALRSWRIGIGPGFAPSWTINDKTFDPSRADAFPLLGTVETWELHNDTAVAHLMHLHHTDWYVVARNGRRPPPWEEALKETFFLDPGDRLLVAGRFSDHAGKYVIHCHMLDHEDHGLMTQFETVGVAARAAKRRDG